MRELVHEVVDEVTKGNSQFVVDDKVIQKIVQDPMPDRHESAHAYHRTEFPVPLTQGPSETRY
jgi:hypothetical protein